MFALTWNINGQQAARARLYRYLSRQRDEGCVAVQELTPYGTSLPDRSSFDAEVRQSTGGRFHLAAMASGPGRQALIVSTSWATTDEQSSARLVSTTAKSSRSQWQGLRIVGVHARSHVWADAAEDRAHHMAMLLHDLPTHWKGGPAIVLGDFNAAPYDLEMTGSNQLGASRERRELVVHGGCRISGPSLYNPCWTLLADAASDSEPAGTTFYAKPSVGVRWHCYDQILVSEELARHWSASWAPRKVQRLSGHQILDRDGRCKAPISDHVPVRTTLNIHEVPECRV